MTTRAPERQLRRTTQLARPGTTLVELLVALPLTVLVAVMAVSLLLHVARTGRGQGARLATTRELRHARLILSRDLEGLFGSDIVTLSDSLLEFRAHLGVLVVCASPGGAEIEVANAEHVPGVSWVTSVRGGDDLVAWAIPAIPSDTPQRWVGNIVAPPVAIGTGPCGPTPTVPMRPRWRLTLHAPPGASLAPGMPAGVGRPVRFRHYLSGSRWWLGRRTRDAVGWDITQPVAGPLLSRAEEGMRVRGYSRAGVATTVPESLALVQITLRAPRRLHDAQSAVVDSAVLDVALRAAPSHRPPP